MGRRTKQLDMVFVLDATNSTKSVFEAMTERAMDTAFQIHTFKREVDDQYAVVIYRDPVDNPGDPDDKNEFLPLTRDRESITDYLAGVKSHGGRDDPEDWVGAFELALHRIQWRPNSKKCLFWITDANAHGREYSLERRDRHDDEAPKLTRLIQEAARKMVYFIGINVKKDGDPGCEKTLRRLREIYEAEDKLKYVTVENFECEWDHNDVVDDNPNWNEEGWPKEVLDRLKDTITATLMRAANSVIDHVV
jgi:hypothetical protein